MELTRLEPATSHRSADYAWNSQLEPPQSQFFERCRFGGSEKSNLYCWRAKAQAMRKGKAIGTANARTKAHPGAPCGRNKGTRSMPIGVNMAQIITMRGFEVCIFNSGLNAKFERDFLINKRLPVSWDELIVFEKLSFPGHS